ncbi:hypothetical protein ADU37_CDS14490 [Thermococcus sp. 2319x1]|uniref:hypothetical protein n=1 Tax=Thermococcus sp. 2319x1 TaxID=1674923 RepID=UPI00073ACA6C|nr:hypothetical protein [Thermococcus sp. 2319x1]ALV63148.1 hypothetical protein ADU37_CDS14490 [Thermococcus sp. 2319x1]
MWRKLLGLMLVLIVGTALGQATSNYLSIEQINVQGKAKVFIFQPRPEGGVKLLKQGVIPGGVLSLRTETKNWEKALKGRGLKAPPTPIAIYFTKDGNIGIKSVVKDRPLQLEGMINLDEVFNPSKKPQLEIPILPRIRNTVKSLLTSSSCPNGYEELNSRYCIIENWEYLKDSYYADSRTFTEYVPFMGMKVRTESYKTIDKMGASWGIQLTSNTRAMWTFNLDGIPMIDFGSSYGGSTLRVSYAPSPSIPTDNGHLERYINLPLKYVIATYNVPVYDKWNQQYGTIPIAGVYPIQVMLTGTHNLDENDVNSGLLLTNYLVSSNFPTKQTTTEEKVIKTDSYRVYNNIVFDFQGSSGYDFYSTPLGGDGFNWIWSKVPVVGALSITLGYSEGSESVIAYNIDIVNGAANQYYYVTIIRRDITLVDSNNVEVGMYFAMVDDGLGSIPCIGDVCPSSLESGTTK